MNEGDKSDSLVSIIITNQMNSAKISHIVRVKISL
jgi:hypothetical protein